MRPLAILYQHLGDVRRIILDHGVVNPRVFRSVARREDSESSDLDLLVDPVEGKTSLVTLVRLKRALEGVLG